MLRAHLIAGALLALLAFLPPPMAASPVGEPDLAVALARKQIHVDSATDQDSYQGHATHKAFVEKYSHLWAKVVVYDMSVL